MKQNYIQQKNKITLFRLWASLLFTFAAGIIFAQQSYTFTNASNTGSLGPSVTQVTTAYVSTNLSGSVVVSGGIQIFRIPVSGNYGVKATGASGGGPSGGLGAEVYGEFNFTAGDSILVLVGQMGMDGNDGSSATGGGGSFVVRKNSSSTTTMITGRPVTALVIGGGGGANPASTTFTGANAALTTTGNAGTGGTSFGPGGVNGNGGSISASSNNSRGGGGGGYLTDGEHTNTCGTGGLESGSSFLAGGMGGLSTSCSTGYPGGFGGGGGAISSGWRSGGGGGGYSGGGGGQTNSQTTTHTGGGGASYSAGTNSLAAIATASGHGRVIINELCNIKIYASGSNSLNPSICSGQSLTLTTTAVSNYTWNNNNSSTTSIVVNPTGTTTYSVIGTSTANCQAIAFITVTVSSGLPVLSIANPSSNICMGKTVSLTATGALTYTWANPGVVNGQTFTPNATTVYSVTGQNGCGISTANTTITVAPLAVSILASSTLVCQGSPATLTAVAVASTYTWLPSALGGSTTAVAPTSNSVYTVAVSDGTCAGTQTIAVSTKITPTVNVSVTSSVLCEGDQVVITANGANNYTWMPGNMTGNTVTVSPSASTVYVVTGENLNNCSAVNQQILLVMPSPTINVTASKLLVCAGQTVYLSATGGNGYQWTGGPATYSNVVTPNTTTVYTVTGTHTLNICTAAKTITISAITYTLTLPTNTDVCLGGSVTVNASGATSYVWNSISTGNLGVFTLQPPATTTVTLVATTQSLSTSCPVTHTFEVLVNPLPSLTVTATRAVVCKNESNTLTVTGAQTYTWTSTAGGSTFTIKPGANTTYSVAGTDGKGCVNTFNYQAKVNPCIGIGESTLNDSGLMVYPNPNNGVFTVKAESAMDLILVNELGQELRKFTLSESANFSFDVKDLKPGIYFIHTENRAGALVLKIIVN